MLFPAIPLPVRSKSYDDLDRSATVDPSKKWLFLFLVRISFISFIPLLISFCISFSPKDNVDWTNIIILTSYTSIVFHYTPASEVSREVANLTEIKSLHTPICSTLFIWFIINPKMNTYKILNLYIILSCTHLYLSNTYFLVLRW